MSEAIVTPTLSLDEEWEEIERQRARLKQSRFEKLLDQNYDYRDQMTVVDGKIRELFGDIEIANQQVVLEAARRAGETGVPLAELRRLIPDPNHLNKAREQLSREEDENKKKVQPLTKEARGDSNELRIYLVKPEPVK